MHVMRYASVGAGAIALLMASTSANAVLINANGTGIDYSLTETGGATNFATFDLHISGINGVNDTEGGRSGVNAIAFGLPAGFVTAAFIPPPTGFNFVSGGLNSGGCDTTGNFFCFDNTAIPNGGGPSALPAFAADSTLDFNFNVTLAAGDDFLAYNPAFKIDWVGSQNNYDLISKEIGITDGGPPPPPPTVDEPGALAALGTSLLGFAGITWWRRPRKATLRGNLVTA